MAYAVRGAFKECQASTAGGEFKPILQRLRQLSLQSTTRERFPLKMNLVPLNRPPQQFELSTYLSLFTWEIQNGLSHFPSTALNGMSGMVYAFDGEPAKRQLRCGANKIPVDVGFVDGNWDIVEMSSLYTRAQAGEGNISLASESEEITHAVQLRQGFCVGGFNVGAIELSPQMNGEIGARREVEEELLRPLYNKIDERQKLSVEEVCLLEHLGWQPASLWRTYTDLLRISGEESLHDRDTNRSVRVGFFKRWLRRPSPELTEEDRDMLYELQKDPTVQMHDRVLVRLRQIRCDEEGRD